jgi:hypothetical protein
LDVLFDMMVDFKLILAVKAIVAASAARELGNQHIQLALVCRTFWKSPE